MTLFMVFLESPPRVLVFRNPPNPWGGRESCYTAQLKGAPFILLDMQRAPPGVVRNLRGSMWGRPPQESDVENLSPSFLRGRTLLGLFFSC